MTIRFPVVLMAFLMVLVSSGIPLPDGGAWGSAEAARRKPRAAASRSKRVVHRPAATPSLPDDPSVPLGTAWKKHLDRFFAQNRPAFGAFVALDPATGQVIALSEYSSNPSAVAHPATSSAFPAASIFKIITAATLLEKSAVRSGTSACYRGGSHGLEESHLKDSKGDRSCQSLSTAFAHSTNAVFGKLAIKNLDADDLFQMAERFGFNRSVRVDGFETQSRVQKATNRLTFGRMAAGFVNSTLSPLHGAVIAAIIASGGVMPTGLAGPRDGGAVIGSETVTALRQMMMQTSTGGTASKYLAGIAARGGGVAVKTGTLSSRDGSGLLNTWMVGFFPAVKPEIAFAAHIAQPGGGPIKAGHLTRFALETFLKLRKARMGQS